MENSLIIPGNINENDYLPISAVSAIWRVGGRQIRNIALQEEVHKQYYSTVQHSDLVCYLAIDVYRVAVIRRNSWPDKIKGTIPKKDTYECQIRSLEKIHEMKERVEELIVKDKPVQPVGGQALIVQIETLEVLKKIVLLLEKPAPPEPTNVPTKRLAVYYGIPVVAFLIFMVFAVMKLQ